MIHCSFVSNSKKTRVFVKFVYTECMCTQSRPALCESMDYSPPGSSVHGIYPGKNTGVGCHLILQGIFWTQESSLHLLSPALAGRFFTTSATWDAAEMIISEVWLNKL